MSNQTKAEIWCKTLYEMLCDRNYRVDDITSDNLLINLTQTESSDFVCKDSDGKSIYITNISFVQNNGNVGKNDIIKILDNHMKPADIKRCILVLDNVKLTPAAKNYISERFLRYIFEPFFTSDLAFNITKSLKVPKHIILSETQTQKILKKYNATKEKMPLINYNDAVARYLGMLPGQMCEIKRISETGGIYYFYRVCHKSHKK